MSGTKRMTVDERLNIAEGRLRAVEQDRAEPQRLAAENRALLQQRHAEQERRHRELQQELSGIRQDVAEAERQTSGRLADQGREMRNNFDRLEGGLQDLRNDTTRSMDAIERETSRRFMETDRRIAQTREDLERQIGAVREDLEYQIGDVRGELRNHITAIAQEEDERRARLASWVGAAETLRHYIDGNLPHERFFPGELGRLSRHLELARRNPSDMQTALTQAQGAYLSLSELRARTEAQEDEWEFWRTAARQSLQEVLSLARDNARCAALDTEGNPMGEQITVDEWTSGQLGRAAAEAEQRLQDLADDKKAPGTDTLRRIAGEEAARLEECVRDAVAASRLAALSSLLRMNLAEECVQALVEHMDADGDAVESAYSGGNLSGDLLIKVPVEYGELTILVSRDGAAGSSALTVNFFENDCPLPADYRRLVVESVVQHLSAKGLMNISPYQEISERPNEGLRHPTAFAQPAPQAEARRMAAT